MNSPQVTRHNLPQSLAGIEQVLTVRLGEKNKIGKYVAKLQARA